VSVPVSSAPGFDPVERPKGYNSHPSGVQTIEVAEHLSFCIGNALKYTWRHEHKGSALEDLRKGAWYVRHELGLRLAREEWRAVVRDPRYEVSSLGRVRRAASAQCRKLVPVGRGGYLTFSTVVEGRAVVHYVHHAVAEAFIGPRPPGMDVAHGDGIPAHNALANLRYATPRENAADRVRHGTINRGGLNGQARLTSAAVDAIRALQGTRSSYAVGREFGVHGNTVGRIWRGEAWRTEASVPEAPIAPIAAVLDAEPSPFKRDVFEALWRAGQYVDGLDDLERALALILAEVARREALAPTP